MNATLIMAFILILIVVATVITKKLPFNFVLFIAPVLCALILGHSIEETSTFIVEQLASMMKSAGFMLLFAFLYYYLHCCILFLLVLYSFIEQYGLFHSLQFPPHFIISQNSLISSVNNLEIPSFF